MNLSARIAAFMEAYGKWPASWPHLVKEGGRDVLYATWLIGNDYRGTSKFYGAYPPGYLKRVMALFPDAAIDGNPDCPRFDPGCISADGECHDACEAPRWPVLHVFSGSLPPGEYDRLDVNPANRPELVGHVRDARKLACRRYSLVIADPPYSAEDATKYGTKMIDRRRTMAALAQVTRVGGHLVWLDVCWPMHRKAEWVTVGRIAIVRSTNHRIRMATIFQRVAP